jgi:type IV pilus assembly protein PilQ
MRIFNTKTAAIIAVCTVFCFICVPYMINAAEDDAKQKGAAPSNMGTVEKINFQKLKGKERVVITLSKPTPFKAEDQTGKTVHLRLDNTFVPDELRMPRGEGQLENVNSAVAEQKTDGAKQWAIVTIDLKERVPYNIRQNGHTIVLDFNVASLLGKTPLAAAIPKDTPANDISNMKSASDSEMASQLKGAKYTGQKITLDFQDANIKSVLRLLSEVSGRSIVSSEDVKGTVTVSMKNVPWDQALDTIVSLNSLAMTQADNVIWIMTAEKFRKDAEERRKAEAAVAEEAKKKKEEEQKLLAEQGRLRQIAIEAKIVEANDTFVRNLGVRWGTASNQKFSSGDYVYGISGGTNTAQSNSKMFSYPSGIGYVDATTNKAIQMAAVNFPGAVAAPTLGFVIGGANMLLEAQLQALETTSQGKIISSPKVTTMDNVKAVIEQGEDVPYVTPASASSPATVTFKKAVLKLEVKPTITSEGRISMEILATNDQADYAKAEQLQGNPPINTSKVESKIVINDGDTIVIGGVLKTEDTKGTSGVPWLSRIPVLGWLFKEEDLTKKRKQLLIFVTPKIIKHSPDKNGNRFLSQT